MKVTYWTSKGLAYIWPEQIAKENRMSIRFDLGDGETITIKKNDIVSIEEEETETKNTRENVKFTPGKVYASENWDKWTEIASESSLGRVFVKGWTLSTEKVHTDVNGNEYILMDGLHYYAYNKF